MKPKPMTAAEWRTTPYAKSEAKDADKAIRDLLVKRGVRDIQHTETTLAKVPDTVRRAVKKVAAERWLGRDAERRGSSRPLSGIGR